MSFIHLHLHTEYSMLDSVIMVPKLVEKAKKCGMNAVAMTDHGTLLGLYPFWNECVKNNIKPIIGCEVYVSRTTRFDKETSQGKDKPYHLVLLAKTQTGYHNLVKLVSKAHLEGFYRKPRLDKELLEKYHQGLICLTACLAGEVPLNLLSNNYEKAFQAAKYFQDLFGQDNFYLELQRNGLSEQELANVRLAELAKKIEAPLVATCDAHYLEKGDSQLQEIMWCVSDGKRIDDPTRRLTFGEEFYVKSPQEMENLFADIPAAVANTQKIADSIENISIKFDRIQPKFWGDLNNLSADQILRQQTYEGAKRKYPEITDALRQRLDYELKVVHDKGYDDYFLIVGDLMRWARSQGIIVSVRGSAGGSVVAYCLDIINIEPLSWNCYFERFLNPERPSPPDIDIDLQDNRRDEVIDYIKDKYGEGFSAICAIGRMKTKAAIKDIGRVFGIELSLTEKLSKMVHIKFGKVKKIKQMIQDDSEFAAIIEGDERLKNLVELVSKVEGIARHVSTHACGHLIAPKAITEYIPVQLETGTRGRVITQIEGAQLEELGFMKFDFLGLRNLTILNNALKLINDNNPDTPFTLESIPLDDQATFKIFSQGKTTGVFQFESSGMKKYLKELKPTNLEDICFMAAAYRPGPMQYISGYIDCKFGRKEPEYLVDQLRDIVGKTYGYAIYQEQVIKITVDVAGYSMGQADLLRRAMGKKKLDIMQKEEPRFKEGVMKKGYSQEVANKLWQYLLPFADYGFNKAHAAGYALVAYWTAYMKTHYATEFIAALIQSDIDDMDRLTIDIEEAGNLGIKILPPDINLSGNLFQILNTDPQRKTIIFGLEAIRNLGGHVAAAIVQEREKNGTFSSLEDFLLRVKHKDLNKKSLEALAKAGALKAFCETNKILVNMDNILKFIHNVNSHADDSQPSLFGSDENKFISYKLNLVDCPPSSAKETLAFEKEYLGFYLSGHPFAYLEKYFGSLTLSYQNLAGKIDQNVKIVGLIARVKKIMTKKNEPMLFVVLENTRESLEIVVFPRVLEESRPIWEEGLAVMVEGKVSSKDQVVSLIVNKVEKITPENIKDIALNLDKVSQVNNGWKNHFPKKGLPKEAFLVLDTIPDKAILLSLKNILVKYPGNISLFLQVNKQKIVTKTKISHLEQLKTEVENLVGKGSLTYK